MFLFAVLISLSHAFLFISEPIIQKSHFSLSSLQHFISECETTQLIQIKNFTFSNPTPTPGSFLAECQRGRCHDDKFYCFFVSFSLLFVSSQTFFFLLCLFVVSEVILYSCFLSPPSLLKAIWSFFDWRSRETPFLRFERQSLFFPRMCKLNTGKRGH